MDIGENHFGFTAQSAKDAEKGFFGVFSMKPKGPENDCAMQNKKNLISDFGVRHQRVICPVIRRH